MKKLISIVVPVYNEEKNILSVYEEIVKNVGLLGRGYDYEIIFINDGSVDGCGKIIKGLAEKDAKVKYLEFARNFGKEIATSAGIYHARGDAVIMMDADLQHPPALIPEFVKKWEDGAEVVVGVRKKTHGGGLVKKIGSSLFYIIINTIGETKIIPHATDYRLIDKKVAQEFGRFTERSRMTRGLIDWMGFKREYVYFSAPDRKNGGAKYSKVKLLKLALSSFVSYSLFPLKLAGYLGVLTVFLSGALGFFVIIEEYFLGDPLNFHFSGTGVLALSVVFLVGIILSCLGLIALYIASIHGEVANRPLYIIREKSESL